MCVGQQTRGPLTESSADNAIVSTITGHHMRGRTYRQPMKPRLPRKLTSSARINLNRYWNILGELTSCDVMEHAQSFDDVDLANEINENIANELLEAEDQSTRFVPVRGPETCEGSTFSTPTEGERSPLSPRAVTLRLTPSTEGSPLSRDSGSVNPEAIDSNTRKFWNVFLDSSASKRKASKSIMKIVKKLSKHSE